MKYGIILSPILLVIVLALLSGCSSVSMGDLKPQGIFGAASPEQQDILMCLMASDDYIDPRQVTHPRFERFNYQGVIVTSRLVNETPVDDIVMFSLDTPRIYYWAFYEGCQPGDVISMTLYYTYYEPGRSDSNAVIILQTNQTITGQYGPVYGSVQRPDAGWMQGQYTIGLYVTRGSNTTPITSTQGGAYTVDGPTETRPLPCQEEAGVTYTIAPGALSTVYREINGSSTSTPTVQASASRTPVLSKTLVLVKTLPAGNVTPRITVMHK